MSIVKKSNDDSINNSDKTALHDAGVDVAGLAPSPEAPKEEVVMDIGGPDVSSDDLSATGIHFVDKSDLSALAEAKQKADPTNVKDLEDEFRLSLVSPVEDSASVRSTVVAKETVMSGLLGKIREKLGLKKSKVKEELSSLKKMKDGISKDISDIKELEESQEKIELQMKKIDTIKEEMEAIEKEVGEELKR